MKEQEEEFRDIPGFDGYQVSNLGRVKSLAREIKFGDRFRLSKERILKGWTSNNGYNTISLSLLNGKKISKSTRQVIAITFLNHVPNGFKVVVDHINNNKLDNRLENLQLISNRENTSKDLKNGTSKYIGVNLHKHSNKWRANIRVNGKRIHLGHFKTELEASEYYQNALKAIENNEEIVVKKPIQTSSYKGVSWHKQSNKWKASIYINGKTKHIGHFNTELEAHNSYQNKLSEINSKLNINIV